MSIRDMPPGRLAIRIAVVVVVIACGAAHLILGGAHLVAVLSQAASGRGHGGAALFTYDFHFVSLVLLGLVLVVPGVVCLTQVLGLARGRPAAWTRATWSALVLTAINGALLPIQGFAVPLVAVAGLALPVLLLTRPRADGR
jgi:hypothetical protein